MKLPVLLGLGIRILMHTTFCEYPLVPGHFFDFYILFYTVCFKINLHLSLKTILMGHEIIESEIILGIEH